MMTGTPDLVVPPAAAILRLGSMPFVWLAVTGATLYTLQIATDAGFTAIVTQVETTLVQVEASFPLNGSYYWRVRATDGSTTVNSATARQFTAPAFVPAQDLAHVTEGQARLLNQFKG